MYIVCYMQLLTCYTDSVRSPYCAYLPAVAIGGMASPMTSMFLVGSIAAASTFLPVPPVGIMEDLTKEIKKRVGLKYAVDRVNEVSNYI